LQGEKRDVHAIMRFCIGMEQRAWAWRRRRDERDGRSGETKESRRQPFGKRRTGRLRTGSQLTAGSGQPLRIPATISPHRPKPLRTRFPVGRTKRSPR
jgi:hypothetical protein